MSPVLDAAGLTADTQFASRGAIVEATVPAGVRGRGVPESFRQVGPVLAGMPGRGDPVEVGDPSRSDVDELLGAAGMAAGEIAALRSEGVVA